MCAVPGPLSDCNPDTDELLFFFKLSFLFPHSNGMLTLRVLRGGQRVIF